MKEMMNKEVNRMKINFIDLEEELKHFDYTYMMSDDFRVWKNGEYNKTILITKINKHKKADKKRTNILIKKYKSKYGTQF